MGTYFHSRHASGRDPVCVSRRAGSAEERGVVGPLQRGDMSRTYVGMRRVGFIGSPVAVEENLFVGGGAGNELAMQVSSAPRGCCGREQPPPLLATLRDGA